MKTLKTLFLLTFVFLFFKGNAQALNDIKSIDELPPTFKIDYRIDNMNYWRKMAELGLVTVEPYGNIKPAKYTNSEIFSSKVVTSNSPDIPVTSENVEQSENSVFIDPQNKEYLLNSNNSNPIGGGSIYGADYFVTEDGGQTYNGQIEGTGGSNSGDPTTAIGLNGWLYNNFIDNGHGQSVAYSQDNGATWETVKISYAPDLFAILDKNHMWIDNSLTSPYEGNLYVAWTEFGGNGPNEKNIELSRSTDNGLSWSATVNISQAVNAVSHCQGVNLQTGINGEVYAVYAIYDDVNNLDENSLGFSRSFNGGVSWENATRIIDDIRGIRQTGITKNMRVQSFPVMAVDISTESTSGNIYICWTNIGVPGTNTGDDVDIYLIKSVDGGDNWSNPIRVNQDPIGLGNVHYLPWITCDPENGNLAVIYYDDRNVGGADCEVFCSFSNNAGEIWEDIKVSDVSFTPSPIPGLTNGYMGDYLAIQARDRKIYPCWTDNRTGTAMTYISPFEVGPFTNQHWVAYNNHTVKDAAGNNNGQLDYGETVNLDISMENIGDQPATDVLVTLTTESVYAMLIDNQEDYGNFAVDEQKTINDGFSFSIDNTVPHNESIIFKLAATDINDTTVFSTFKINANAPSPKIVNFTIEDSTGNQNNRLDPGEDAIIKVEIHNVGAHDALENDVELISNNSFLTVITQSINIDTLKLTETYNISFDVSVPISTPDGFFASLTCNVTSQYHSATADFNPKIGLIIEDWETGTLDKFDWQNTGDIDWFVQTSTVFEGQYSLQAGALPFNTNSKIEITLAVAFDDEISFYKKLSSGEDNDVLRFYIDDAQVGLWSGDADWGEFSYPVSAGMHTFKWQKNRVISSTTPPSDTAWIDNILLPVSLATTAFSGDDIEICETNTAQLQAVASLYNSLSWATSGDGTFDNENILNPIYTLGTLDIDNGSVTLTFTAIGTNSTASDELIITINKSPELIINYNPSLCFQDNLYLNVTGVFENYSSHDWTTNGDGVIDSTTVNEIYYKPGSQDITNAKVTFYLNLNALLYCEAVADSFELAFLFAPEIGAMSGDDTVDVNIVSESTYEIDNIIHDVESFDITISPPEAGNIGVLTNITDPFVITWNEQFEGEAVISSIAQNLCGADTKDYPVFIYSSLGLEELFNKLNYELYPNPNTGKFTIQMKSNDVLEMSIKVINVLGETILENEDITINGTFYKEFDLQDFDSGTYFVVFAYKQSVFSQKIIVN